MGAKLQKYQIIASVESVSGHQMYYVEARDEKHAKQLFEAGEGEFVAEELEVTELGEIEVSKWEK